MIASLGNETVLPRSGCSLKPLKKFRCDYGGSRRLERFQEGVGFPIKTPSEEKRQNANSDPYKQADNAENVSEGLEEWHVHP